MGFDVLETIKVGENIALEGEIFDLNITETRTGGLKVDFGITDHTDSITGRMFLNNKNDEVSISLGKWVKVTGKFDQDRFTQELYVMAQKVDIIESRTRTRVDNAEIKRVELHAHTNMSEMSSNIDAKALAKKAKEFGHKAVAVTDYGVAHAYPFAFKESSDDFKVIFGLEAYVVDDEQEMITRPKDKNIEEEIYVVFDIETTGFDPYNDKIIEIGAIKLKGREVIDKFSTFINPEVTIPQVIIDLTKITDDIVKDAPKIEEVLPQFLEFCENTTIVAHNAKFDVGFITQKAKQQNLEYAPSVIDTLHWAKVLLTDLKRYNLKALSNYFKVSLDNHHRAIDDALATSEVFQKLLSMILSRGVLKLTEINEQIQTNVQNADTFNVMILVKNQEGLHP